MRTNGVVVKSETWTGVTLVTLLLVGYLLLPKPNFHWSIPVETTATAATAVTTTVAAALNDDELFNAIATSIFVATTCVCAEELSTWMKTHEGVPSRVTCGGHYGDTCSRKKGADVAFFEKTGHWYDHKDAIVRPWRSEYSALK